jgi:hypothetical protein
MLPASDNTTATNKMRADFLDVEVLVHTDET